MVSPPPPLFALVIGIDKYFSDGIRDLSGAVADADAVDAFLQETLRVPKHQIKNLRNEEATRLTIETEIKDLGNNPAIKKDDPILIFYAGHGAEAKATLGWSSANGKIQMLVPYDFIPSGSDDSERGQGVLDMRLSYLLTDLAAKKSDNITVILDCCHSGSGTRTDDDDPTFAVRGIDLPETYTVAQDLLHDIADARASVVAMGFEKSGLLSHVLLSACQAEQTAKEKHGRGIFTSALLGLLQEKGVGKLTYKDVIINLPDLHAQNPQCEGIHQSRCLFNSKVANPQRESYLIRASSDTPGQYILDAGEAHGITKGAELAVFADRTMTSETHIGTVVVSSITAFTTTCDFSPRNNANETPFPLPTPGFVSQTQVGEGQGVSLLIEPDEGLLGVFKQMADEMQAGKRGFRWVNSRDDEPDLVVAADGDVVHFEIMDKICRQHGLTRMPFEVKIDDADAIHRILRSSSDFYWHLHRSNERNPLTGKVTLECMKLKETGEYTNDLRKVLKPDCNGENLNVGGVIMVDVDEDAIYGFKFTNTTSVPLYVSVFYFDVSDLSISSYYQPGHAKKDTDVSLPPGDSLTIGYGASGTVPHMYRLRKGQNVDVGFLRLFFLTEYMDLSGVVQNSPFNDVRQSGRPPVRKRYLWHTMCVAVVQTKGGRAAS
ncbi:caspase domain-containing protein [Armillaria borealis]|uniref:Caspase domain-containing protein n=1 Tax=Armillaria borealis TaxID=47425 RepID=A0AA39MNL1_9AGAR|nr:caspase domain-containing protein [Armillaria borealis]